MAKMNTFKRFLALVLALVMCFGMLGISAQAAQTTTPAMVENFDDTYYKQDGSAGTGSDWEVHLSKEAAATAQENVFDITLEIQTKDTSVTVAGATHGAVTLVLDLSGSMIGKPFANLKSAVLGFLDKFAQAEDGEKRLVSIVVFGKNAYTIQPWTDVAVDANLANAKAAVNAVEVKYSGGLLGDNYVYQNGKRLCAASTNMEAGLALGRNLLDQTTTLEDVPVTNQSLILFSDGEPNESGDVDSTSVESIGDRGNKSKDDINSILAAVSAAKIAVKYNYDGRGVLEVPPFTRTYNSNDKTLSVDLLAEADKVITAQTKVTGITDPMGTGVTMVNAPDNYNEATKMWDLSKLTPTVENGITTYTITYQVQLDPAAVAEDAKHPGYTVLTPANGATVLNYVVDGEAKSAAFNEPNIRGVLPVIPTYDYTVVYSANYGQNPTTALDGENEAATTAESKQMTADANMFSRAHYQFTGWNTDPNGNGTAYAEGAPIALDKDNNTLVLYAQWEEDPKFDYTLTYNANFGENETKADGENVTQTYATEEDFGVDANSFTRPNYFFKGWNTDANGNGTGYAPGAEVILTSDNNALTLYAQWQEEPKFDYTVTYDANFDANEIQADEENELQTYATQKTITVNANMFTRPNHDFLGWATTRDGQIAYNPEDTLNFANGGSQILYAVWKEHPKYSYTLIYNGNGGELVDAIVSYGDSENKTDVYATSNLYGVDANTFERQHYVFIGWNTQADGNGTDYAPGAALTLTSDNNALTLYAQWEEDPKFDYTVIYNANFGEMETVADSENILQTYATAYEIGVDANQFTREHFEFLGWATTPDGEAAYEAGDVLYFENGGEMELFAVWEAVQYEYIVEYLVRVDEGAYNLYLGNLPEDIHLGGSATFGTVIDETAVNPPAVLEGDLYTYDLVTLEGITVADGDNVVKVYYQTYTPAQQDDEEIVDDEIIIEDEEVPLAGSPKTGDAIGIYAALCAMSGAGMVMLGRKKKEQE